MSVKLPQTDLTRDNLSTRSRSIQIASPERFSHETQKSNWEQDGLKTDKLSSFFRFAKLCFDAYLNIRSKKSASSLVEYQFLYSPGLIPEYPITFSDDNWTMKSERMLTLISSNRCGENVESSRPSNSSQF